MTLGAGAGDLVELEFSGPDSDEAAQVLCEVVEGLMHDHENGSNPIAKPRSARGTSRIGCGSNKRSGGKRLDSCGREKGGVKVRLDQKKSWIRAMNRSLVS